MSNLKDKLSKKSDEDSQKLLKSELSKFESEMTQNSMTSKSLTTFKYYDQVLWDELES